MNRVIVVTPVAERNNKSTSTKSLGLNSTLVSSSDPTKSSLLRQPNAGVRIIGGVSADVTVDFVNKLVKWNNEGKDNGNGQPYVLCSDLSLEAKLKPIEAGSPMRIGVLATNAILNAGFYQDKLQKEVVLPLRAVNTIILASDDLQDILPYDDTLLKKCVYPVDSLARSTVKLAQSAIQSF
ncbi:probable amino-acid racemase [Tanacetum coccineum]